MWFVYGQTVITERVWFVTAYDTPEEAVKKISSLYNMDARSGCTGENYYFMKKH